MRQCDLWSQNYRGWEDGEDWVMVDPTILRNHIEGYSPNELRQWRRNEGRRWLDWGELPSAKARIEIESLRLRVFEAIDTDIRPFPKLNKLPRLRYLSMPLAYSESISPGSLPPSIETLDFTEDDPCGLARRGAIQSGVICPSVKRVRCYTGQLRFSHDNFPNLRSVTIRFDSKNAMLQELLRYEELEELSVGPFNSPDALSEIARLYPRRLGITGGELETLAPLQQFSGLQHLNVSKFNKLTSLSSIGSMRGLISLFLGSCTKLEDISAISSMPDMICLEMWSCTHLTDISPVALAPRLSSLFLAYCTRIADLRPILRAKHLRYLNIMQCTNIDLANAADELVAMGLEELWVTGKRHLYRTDGTWHTNVKKLNVNEPKTRVIRKKAIQRRLGGYPRSH
jgi:hypothetical protein